MPQQDHTPKNTPKKGLGALCPPGLLNNAAETIQNIFSKKKSSEYDQNFIRAKSDGCKVVVTLKELNESSMTRISEVAGSLGVPVEFVVAK